MTEKELLQYRAVIKEIEDIEKRISKLVLKEVDVVSGKVNASMQEHPYTQIRVGVQMEDPRQAQIRDNLIADYRQQLKKLLMVQKRVEAFVQQIEEPELRLIFRQRYIDGFKLREIGKLLNMDRSSIGKKINNYLNFPPVPQNVVL